MTYNRRQKMAKVKLTDLLKEAFEEKPKVDKHQVIEGVRNYGIVGKSLYNKTNIMEIAKQLGDIAESAHTHILGEESDWFDKVSVNRNMKSLKGSVVEFQKTAKESHILNQRLTALYEDIGHVLNRYYDIDEGLDKHDPEELDNDFKDREDKDIDNDGDSDESDEYLHKKRKAITKAVKKEVKDAMRQTREQLEKRPTKRLQDISRNVYSPGSNGYFGTKKK